MVKTILVTLGDLGPALIDTCNHIFGDSDAVILFHIDWQMGVEESRVALRNLVESSNDGDGIVLLTDMFGDSASNIALGLHKPGSVEIVTGVNLPMVIRAMTLPTEATVGEAASLLKQQGQKSIEIASERL